MEPAQIPDKQVLIDIVRGTMPFGKHKGRPMMSLPVSYLEWFARKGFPNGKLGHQLQTLHEIKINGLEEILYRIKRAI